MFPLENSYTDRKDEIDGIYLNLNGLPANWHPVTQIVPTTILNSSRRGASDFNA